MAAPTPEDHVVYYGEPQEPHPLRPAYPRVFRAKFLAGDLATEILVIATDFYAAAKMLERCFGVHAKVQSLAWDPIGVLIAKEDVGVEG